MEHLVIWISNIHIWMMRRVIIILVALRSVCVCEYAANVRYVEKQGQVGYMCLAETAATVSRRMLGATCKLSSSGRQLGRNQWKQICTNNHQRECRKHCGAAQAQLAVYAANTWLKHCHNTAQHFTTRCPMLLNPAQQHCSTPLKPSAQQRTSRCCIIFTL